MTDSEYEELNSNYRKALFEEIKKIGKNPDPIALLRTTAGNTQIKLADFEERTGRNQLVLEAIVLSFNPPNGDPARVKVGVNFLTKTDKKEQGEYFRIFKARLFIHANDKGIQYNSSSLFEIDGDYISWRNQNILMTWGTNGADLERYAEKLYGNAPAMLFCGDLSALSLKLIKRKFQVSYNFPEKNSPHLDGSLKLPISDQDLHKIAEIHAKALLARAVDWIIFATFAGAAFRIEDSKENPIETKDEMEIAERLGVLKPEQYFNRRAVDLSPFDLKSEAEGKSLYFSWNAYQTICNSINLGRHLILTGPPGCGKSELAILVARLVGKESGLDDDLAEPKVVTASPGWTSGDLIGRYFPTAGNGDLSFQPGVFLQAIREGRCLIIDEMNRANLDECFGELFTVLSGHSVDLPYQEVLDDAESDQNQEADEEQQVPRKMGTVRIIPKKMSNNPKDRVRYEVGQTFRLIGTMNDVDRSSLHKLSYAFLRRFDVVRIDPPRTRDLQKILEDRWLRGYTELTEPGNLIFQDIRQVTASTVKQATDEHALNLIKSIFCPDSTLDHLGLISEDVVGVATMLDVTNFALEGLRPALSKKIHITDAPGDNNSSKIKAFVTSIIALAITLTVIPQLDSLNEQSFKKTVDYLICCLGREVPFVRLDLDGDRLLLLQETDKSVVGHILDEIARAVRGHYNLTEIIDDLRGMENQ